MPLPKPNADEDREEFMPRCMANDVMNDEFPDDGRRFAVCETLYDNKGGDMGEDRYIKATMKQNAGQYRIVATTNDVDRDGEVVEPRGVRNLESYLRDNPVILWAHNYSKPPVGRATGGEVKDDRIELDVEWADTEFGREIKYLFDNGFMSSFSIGFIPKDHKVMNGTFHWTDWELLEVSAVPVPANAMANILRSVESDGVDMPAVKGLYRDASDYREKREVVEAARRKHENTWRIRLDYLRERR